MKWGWEKRRWAERRGGGGEEGGVEKMSHWNEERNGNGNGNGELSEFVL